MQQFEQGQLYGRFALTSTGCLGPCDTGPSIPIYPEKGAYPIALKVRLMPKLAIYTYWR